MSSDRYETVEGTVWPIDTDGSLEWALRYGDGFDTTSDRLVTASILAAYAALTDPAISWDDAVLKLRRARDARQMFDTRRGGK